MTSATRVAEVSASGRGAIAILRVWGPAAVAITSTAFRANQESWTLKKTPINRIRVGRTGAGLGDEVVAVVVSFRPPEVEIQCHGGPAAVGLVVGALTELGAICVSARVWGRYSTGSFLRADAGEALAVAPTLRVAEILLDQAEGALEADIAQVVGALDSLDRDQALRLIDELIARGQFGVRMLAGWRVVLAGRPNVGKSRLLNALAGFDRAIVAPTPGTTRDIVTVATALGGWPVEIADTAGLRATLDPIERAGVKLARARQGTADLVVVVLDRSEPLTAEDRAILQDQSTALVVANKADLPPAWDEVSGWQGSSDPGSEVGSTEASRADRTGEAARGQKTPATQKPLPATQIQTLRRFPAVLVSAERGDGVDSLVAAIGHRLDLRVPTAGSGVPFRSVHLRRLRAILGRIEAGDAVRARRSLVRWLGQPRVEAEEMHH